VTDPATADSRSARTRLVLSQMLRESAEYATSLVPTYTDCHAEVFEHLTAARRVRLCAERVIDAAIAVEFTAGATVDQIATWLALPVETIQRRLDVILERAAGIDPTTVAADLDAWYATVSGPGAPPNAVSAGLT
jgi:hypothetical protein